MNGIVGCPGVCEKNLVIRYSQSQVAKGHLMYQSIRWRFCFATARGRYKGIRTLSNGSGLSQSQLGTFPRLTIFPNNPNLRLYHPDRAFSFGPFLEYPAKANKTQQISISIAPRRRSQWLKTQTMNGVSATDAKGSSK